MLVKPEVLKPGAGDQNDYMKMFKYKCSGLAKITLLMVKKKQ